MHRLPERWLLPIVVAIALFASGDAARALDLEAYGRVLEAHTREVSDTAGVRVDYPAVARSSDWRTVVESLAASDPTRLRTREERLAFWINAYNVLAIDLVARNLPLESIRDIGSLLRPVWKREAGRIGTRGYTLDEIEHEILRPLGDPRIHAAIVCASVSCPALARTPYRAGAVDAQLDTALERFLADPRKGARFEAAEGVLRLSSIFSWFAEDFAPRGGVLAFLTPHLPEPIQREIRDRGRAIDLAYFDYDWSLNGL